MAHERCNFNLHPRPRQRYHLWRSFAHTLTSISERCYLCGDERTVGLNGNILTYKKIQRAQPLTELT